jgi:hypothetical protein
MNSEEFERIFDEIVDNARNVLVNKAVEYASDADRLHNFKVAAAYLGCTPKQAALYFMTKHLVSISDMVQQDTPHSILVWDEKIGDALNYLILLRAIVEESHEVPF